MRLLVLVVRLAVFFTLFAFALNNQHEASVRWFFGFEWRAPMVFIVLGAFALGCALGVIAMVPGWWKHRASARRRRTGAAPDPVQAVAPPSELPVTTLRRDGL